MTDRYAALRAALPLATPGPWHVDDDTRPRMAWNRHIMADERHTVCFMAHSDGNAPERDEATAAFIANADPTTIADLLAELDAARKDVQRLDLLEAFVKEKGELHLHDGDHPRGLGLGLEFRTLRDAIDAVMPAPPEARK